MSNVDHLRRRFLLGVFVVSGFTGLIYESIWSQYLKLFLGHAGYAQTLVLTIFMGGLALGSWIVARYSAKVRHLLWGYLLVEGLTGVLGMVFHPVFVGVTEFSYNSIIPALPAGLAIDIYKWLLGALLILPQSILLGMTFPLISGGVIRRWPGAPGETLAVLYFSNSMGAGVGVLISGFVMIDAVGLPGAVLTAGLINVVLALAVWAVVRGQVEPVAPAGPASQPGAGLGSGRVARWFGWAAFLTGAASFMYELGWIRMLSQVLGSSTHSFELMLSAFILGLAFGGLFVRKRIERIEVPETYLGGVMMLMGALAALTLPAYNETFDFMAWALRTFTRTPGGYVAFNLVSHSIAVLIMVPSTFCAGMTLPLLTNALMRQTGRESAIGEVYSLNTVGSIVGVLLTVHVLMPWVGVKGVILTGAGIHLALGISRVVKARPLRWGAVAASVATFCFAAFIVKLDVQRIASGVFRTGFASLPRGTTTVLRDGKTATVTLIQQSGRVTIATNGKADAQINMGPGEPSPDEVTMELVAAISLSMHPHPTRVANIGFGSGLTAHTLLLSELVKRVDTIEIEPAMVELAHKGFGTRVQNVFDDPRSHIVYEDAKTFFAASRAPYDIVVSEPSNPWVSGVASLFSDEFYARLVHYMQPDALFVQWLQVYETDTRVVASIVKALSPHFGTYALYDLDDANILILATPASRFQRPDERLLQSPGLRAELERVGVQSIADLQSRRIGEKYSLGAVLEAMSVPPNSDFFPFVDSNAARLRYLQGLAVELPQLTLLPIPFLEFLDGDMARTSTVEPSVHSVINRDKRTRNALAIRRAVLSGKLEDLDQSTAADVLLLDMNERQCREQEGRETWRRSVQSLSYATAPYLTAPELTGLSDRITSSACYRAVDGVQRTWTDLYVAVAARDAKQIVKLGTDLLGSTAVTSKDDLAYLTTLVAVTHLRMGEVAEARGLLLTQWNRLDQGGWYGLALREMLVMSGATHSARVALAHP